MVQSPLSATTEGEALPSSTLRTTRPARQRRRWCSPVLTIVTTHAGDCWHGRLRRDKLLMMAHDVYHHKISTRSFPDCNQSLASVRVVTEPCAIEGPCGDMFTMGMGDCVSTRWSMASADVCEPPSLKDKLYLPGVSLVFVVFSVALFIARRRRHRDGRAGVSFIVTHLPLKKTPASRAASASLRSSSGLYSRYSYSLHHLTSKVGVLCDNPLYWRVLPGRPSPLLPRGASGRWQMCRRGRPAPEKHEALVAIMNVFNGD